MQLDHKLVCVVANPPAKECCPVYLYVLNCYTSKLPKKAKEKDLLYCPPLPTVRKSPDDSWYTAGLVGKNTLQTMVCDV